MKASILEIIISPEEPDLENALINQLALKLHVSAQGLPEFRVLKRSLDARHQPVFRYQVEITGDDKFEPITPIKDRYQDVGKSKPVIIIGAGPAGYFAALECLELGLKPIVLDRGKDVQARRRDLRSIQQDHIVNPNSNYCFGEGGAGTYSDGKLYTRSNKRGDLQKVLRILVEQGADPDILIDAHPHIGSNKLPVIMEAMRACIVNFGGEIHFNQQVTGFDIKGGRIVAVSTVQANEFKGDCVILATGHSARDIFYLLRSNNLRLEPKAYALGVRIEHPQMLIDEIQYRRPGRPDYLPAASYSLACTLEQRGIFSFCMCPGGLMVPAATAPGEIVLNGMSLSRRDSKFANSGLVVSLNPSDFKFPADPFCGLEFQSEVEHQVFAAGDGSQRAPGQRMTDFMRSRISDSLPEVSYIPGVWSAPVHTILPPKIVVSLQAGIKVFSQQMKGYFTEQAVMVATESRTSSPVRIPRNSLSMHPDCEGLFPCGEGAGYAGGIVSAAMDGQACARAAFQYINK